MTKADFMRALQDRNEISITVKGRRSGREVTLPVWFAREGNTLWLLPLHGSRTQWYRNVLADHAVTVRAGRRTLKVAGRPRRERTVIQRVLDRFRKKYGSGDVARYYDHSDAVVALPVRVNREENNQRRHRAAVAGSTSGRRGSRRRGAGSDPGTRRSGGEISHGRHRPQRSLSRRGLHPRG